MNDAQLISVIKETTKEAVQETLTTLGFDMTEPTSIQKDVAHMRTSRRICEMIKSRAIFVTISIIIPVLFTGVLAGLYIAVKAAGVQL